METKLKMNKEVNGGINQIDNVIHVDTYLIRFNI